MQEIYYVIASEAWQSSEMAALFKRLLRHFVPRNDGVNVPRNDGVSVPRNDGVNVPRNELATRFSSFRQKPASTGRLFGNDWIPGLRFAPRGMT